LIEYYIVFCTKRRKPVLVGKIKERLIEIFGQVAEGGNFKILKFVQAYPTVQPNKILKEVSGIVKTPIGNVSKKNYRKVLEEQKGK